MDKIKLPSMVEYVKMYETKIKKYEFHHYYGEILDIANLILKFAYFLSQQPNISMFVPAVFENGEWKILTEPKDEQLCKYCPIEENKRHASSFSIGCEGSRCEVAYENYQDQYQTAIDNVIFEGFEVDYDNIVRDNNIRIWFKTKDEIYVNNSKNKIENLEQLISYNLTLTPKFAKELG